MSGSNERHVESGEDYLRIQTIKDKYETELLAKANVLGVGIGLHIRGGKPTGGISLVVMVTHKVPRSQLDPEDIIPREIEGVSIDVQEVGELRAYN